VQGWIYSELLKGSYEAVRFKEAKMQKVKLVSPPQSAPERPFHFNSREVLPKANTGAAINLQTVC
jgi:hypothetical protein